MEYDDGWYWYILLDVGMAVAANGEDFRLAAERRGTEDEYKSAAERPGPEAEADVEEYMANEGAGCERIGGSAVE